MTPEKMDDVANDLDDLAGDVENLKDDPTIPQLTARAA